MVKRAAFAFREAAGEQSGLTLQTTVAPCEQMAAAYQSGLADRDGRLWAVVAIAPGKAELRVTLADREDSSNAHRDRLAAAIRAAVRWWEEE